MGRSHASVLRSALLSVLSILWACSSAQQAAASEPLSDISILGEHGSAIVRIVGQGIMTPLSPGHFGPQEINTRRQFAVAIQRLFRPASTQMRPPFSDVPSTDPDFDAINSVAPLMQPQAFCPTCQLSSAFHPEAPMSWTEVAVTLASILNSRGQLKLVSSAASTSILAPVRYLAEMPAPARIFVATAVENKIVSLEDLNARKGVPLVTRAGTALLLDAIQRRFQIPNVSQP